MFQLRTVGDFVFMGVVSTLVAAMGVLFLAYPLREMPVDPAAYEAVAGTVETVRDQSARRSWRVQFTLQADARVFETRAVSFPDEAAQWVPGRTRLVFMRERGGPEAGSTWDPIPTYGLAIDGRVARGLQADIAHTNRNTGPWGGLMALTIGLLGLGTMALAWRRRATLK